MKNSSLTQEQVVEKIHIDFKTQFSSSLLPKVEHIETEPINQESLDLIQSLGLNNTTTYTKFETALNNNVEKEYQRSLIQKVIAIETAMPNHRLITLKKLLEVCEKWDLYIAPIQAYKGGIPEKNLHDIKNHALMVAKSNYSYTPSEDEYEEAKRKAQEKIRKSVRNKQIYNFGFDSITDIPEPTNEQIVAELGECSVVKEALLKQSTNDITGQFFWRLLEICSKREFPHHRFAEVGRIVRYSRKSNNDGQFKRMIVAPRKEILDNMDDVNRIMYQPTDFKHAIKSQRRSIWDSFIDPIVVAPMVVNNEILFQIITAWGDEATDDYINNKVIKDNIINN